MVEHVLQRQRNAGQRAEGLARGALAVDRPRGLDRVVVQDVQERVHALVHLGDAVEMSAGDLLAGHLAVGDRLGEDRGLLTDQVAFHRHGYSSSRMRGTRKRSSSQAGAPAATAVRSRPGIATSSR